jgi:hypothetical protein
MKVGKSVGLKVAQVDKMINEAVYYPSKESVCGWVRELVRRMTWGTLINSISNPTMVIKQTNRDNL